MAWREALEMTQISETGCNHNKGFTLIELLVVVAIIGILAAVGVVAYSGYTSGAKNAVIKSNLKQVIRSIIRKQEAEVHMNPLDGEVHLYAG